jgi:hypothetical protein
MNGRRLLVASTSIDGVRDPSVLQRRGAPHADRAGIAERVIG